MPNRGRFRPSRFARRWIMFCQVRLLMFTAAVLACLGLQAPASERVPITLPVPINTPKPNDVPLLTVTDVNTVIAQAVGYLQSVGMSGVIAVTDREGHILAIFRMTSSSGTDARINEQATAKAR